MQKNFLSNPVINSTEPTPNSIDLTAENKNPSQSTKTLCAMQPSIIKNNQEEQAKNLSWKTLNEYSLSSRTYNLYLTRVTSVKETPETLVNICLQSKIKKLEYKIQQHIRTVARFTNIRAKFNYYKEVKANPIQLKKLQNLSETNKNILYRLVAQLYAAIENETDYSINKDISKPYIFWSCHGLNKWDFISDHEFKDNLIIFLVDKHLMDISNPKTEQNEDTALSYIDDSLQLENNVYYVSFIYNSDKSIDINEITIKQIQSNKKLNTKFYFDIYKAKDSKIIQNIKSIKKQVFLEVVYREQVGIWIDCCIKNIQQDLEYNCSLQRCLLQPTLEEEALKLKKSTSLSAINKGILCDFVAFLYESLVTLKKAKDINSKDIEDANVDWEISEPITSELIDELIILTINYYLNILINCQMEEKKIIAQIKNFNDKPGYYICKLSVKRTDTDGFKITNINLIARTFGRDEYGIDFYIKNTLV